MVQERQEILQKFEVWLESWDRYDLDGVLDFMDEEVVFENWTGAIVQGKEALRKAWAPWFQRNGNFRFIKEDVYLNEDCSKMTFQWRLQWPSMEKNYLGLPEIRRGVDLLYFRNGKIFKKLTYSKTILEIDSRLVSLYAP
ncbi:MAG: nuclear transport factor 2 family protein [Bacteroidota bacterium]|nr:nuclear transport factor 2 family protein [Bacteroidota bacterium]